MVVFSSLIRSSTALTALRGLVKANLKNTTQNVSQIRNMGGDHHHFIVQPSRFQYKKFKDLLHYFTMLGLIPITAVVLYANIFIGPAELTEIPEDYVPKHWEYHRHPISRFLARYIYPSPQQEYEKLCHVLYEEGEKVQLRKLEGQVKNLMAQRNDYQTYFYRPIIAKYHRMSKEAAEYADSISGDI